MRRRTISFADERSFGGFRFLVFVIGFLATPSLANAEEFRLTDAKFERLHRELRPAADELWRTIPWNISLLDGQRLAAESGKPLFIWAMDGHPLGCT